MDDAGQPAGVEARDALERLLLEGPRRYTRLQVAELSGMPLERTQRLWRALGFADSADDDPAYSDADVAALRTLRALIDSGFVGPETEATIARAMGQALSRLADWQTDMLADVLAGAAAQEGRDPTPDEAVDAARALLPLLKDIQDYVWRRHLAANADRLLAATGGGDRRGLAGGVAGLGGFTPRRPGVGGPRRRAGGGGLRRTPPRGTT